MSLDHVLLLCQAHDLPLPAKEQRFHPVRKWLADYLWREQRVILEVEGGLFAGIKGGGTALGGHSSACGILRDMEKGNAAQLCGYRYLRATPRQVQTGAILPMLRGALLGDALQIRQWEQWGVNARIR